MLRTSFSILALTALLVPATGHAQNEYEQQVLDILAEVSAVAVDQGYTQVGEKFVSALEAGTAQDHYIDFVDGRDYVMVAVCDVDCSDIDLHLYGTNDEMVGSDEEPDDVPVIELGNVAGGTHRLEVGMFSCDSEPCYYAVGVYMRTGSGSGGGVSGGGAGGDAYVDQVLAIMEAFSGVAQDNGYTPTGDRWVGALDAGGTEDQMATLGGGADYAFIGACDEDCTDMDLALYGPSGDMVAEDTEPDANPVLELRGVRGGEHRVEVRMYTCSSEPCYYAVGLFKRTGDFLMPLTRMPEAKRR